MFESHAATMGRGRRRLTHDARWVAAGERGMSERVRTVTSARAILHEAAARRPSPGRRFDGHRAVVTVSKV
jgi:hypothetical protein